MTDTVLTLWVLIGSAMILFMHSGFAMIEAGFVRVKNVGTVMINNLTDFAICGLIFWAFGMGFMFNGDSAFFGGWDFVAQADYQGMYGLGVSSISYTVLQACFASTVPAIVGGALLERANFKATLIASCLMTGIVYPVAGHWVWGSGGWLAEWGFHDYAGGAVVHGIGGAIAFVGAAILGPRIGKYTNGKSNAMPAHNMGLAALGTFILWFGWYFFNASAITSSDPAQADIAGKVFMNNTLAASGGTMVGLFLSWIKDGKPNVGTMMNAPLAGLVAITSCCDIVEPWAAAVIGGLAAIVMIFAIDFVDKILKVDDPVGAVGVHCFCGAFGSLCTGLWANPTAAQMEAGMLQGLFYGGGGASLGIQAVGVLAIMAWGAGTMAVVYFVLKFTIGLRARREEEEAGMDIASFGMKETCYPEFMQVEINPSEDAFTPVVNFNEVKKH